jgi:hypothetical protein
MPMFVIEVEQAEALPLAEIGARAQATEDVAEEFRWVLSFLSADRHRSYCLFEAPSVEVVRAAVRRAGLPDDAFMEVESMGPALGPTP